MPYTYSTMYKIIGKNNTVRYGCIDEEVDWNVQDFKLYDFFDKEVRGIRKKLTYHKFNFIGINSGPYVLGFAVVDLGAIRDVFAYLFSKDKGLVYTYDKKMPFVSKRLVFPDGPDAHRIEFTNANSSLVIDKSHAKEYLLVDCNFDNKLVFKADFIYGLKQCKPLRVLNPSLPTHWTFTEKFAPLQARSFSLSFDGSSVPVDPETTCAVYDWSGGFLRRETNWFWASIAGINSDGRRIGANFAALVNETYYPENAFWLDGKRTIVPRIRFDFDNGDLYKPWHIYDGSLMPETLKSGEPLVDLVFTPYGERSEKVRAMPVSKLYFRQFIGSFSGSFLASDGTRYQVKDLSGFCEIHRSVW